MALKSVLWFLCFMAGCSPLWAKNEKAGVFDYYVLALSWSPNWCRVEGEAREAAQCVQPLGWILHGLWPQYTKGWPSYCPSTKRPPSRRMSRDMQDIMGSSGLAWYQWKKHGTCSGLDGAQYYQNSRRAFDAIKKPVILRQLNKEVTLPAAVIEEAFLRANPDLTPNMLTTTCRDGYISEVRICLSKKLTPIACGDDIAIDCTLPKAHFVPIKRE